MPLLSCPDLALALSFRPLLSQSQKGSAFVCSCCCDHHTGGMKHHKCLILPAGHQKSDMDPTELNPGIGKGEFLSGSARKEFASCIFQFLETPFLYL